MILTKQIGTVGVYLAYNRYFLFIVGPNAEGDKLGIVRIGGHREQDENVFECLTRELMEEVSLTAKIRSSPVTYYTENYQLEPRRIKKTLIENISPLLIVGKMQEPLSLMFLAQTDNEPIPASETYGILLLTKSDINQLCNKPIRLEKFLEYGGKAIFQKKLPYELILEPGPHVRFLNNLFKLYSYSEMWASQG